MSVGIVALLDDVAALARAAAASLDDVAAGAAKASGKAVGVVIDDTAVTPQYVTGIEPERELPIIKRIAKGSLRNKLFYILPAALLLSQFAPRLLTPILMLGGMYLCYEGAEKIWEALGDHHHGSTDAVVTTAESFDEAELVAGAVRTDFILSAEIMVIALNEVAERPFVARTIVLAIVAVLITALVYGVVALIVKMDDIGLRLAERPGAAPAVRAAGRSLVSGMPQVLNVIAVVGTLAMLWVGGHIVLAGLDHLGWPAFDEVVVDAQEALAGAPVGAVLSWVAGTVLSAGAGVVLGSAVVGLFAARAAGVHSPGVD